MPVIIRKNEKHIVILYNVIFSNMNSELRNLFINPYSPIYNIDLDIHIVHTVIHNFVMGHGDIR